MSVVAPVRVAPASMRWSRLGVWAGALIAVVLLGYTQVALPPQHLLSEYVHVRGGLEPFVAGALALSVAAAALARLVEPAGRIPAGLLRLAAVALVLTAAFPTDEARWVGLSLAGQIHRYAALVAFVAVPAAGATLVAGRTGAVARLARRAVLSTAVAIIGMLLVHPVSPVGQALGGAAQVAEAVLERAVAALVVAVLLTLSWLRPDTGRPRSRSSHRRLDFAGARSAAVALPSAVRRRILPIAARRPAEAATAVLGQVDKQ